MTADRLVPSWDDTDAERRDGKRPDQPDYDTDDARIPTRSSADGGVIRAGFHAGRYLLSEPLTTLP